MLKRLRRIVTGFAFVAIVTSGTLMSASAADINYDNGYDDLSAFFGEKSARSTSRVDMNYSMSTDNWRDLSSTIGVADILITADCTTLGVNHGHAALVTSKTNTVEHYGPTDKRIPGANGKSGYYTVENLWSHVKTCAVIRCDDLSPYNSYSITGNAFNQLVGWSYNPIANKRDKNAVNCATLIWKAYTYGGYDLKSVTDDDLHTMFPADFLRSEINPHLKVVLRINEN